MHDKTESIILNYYFSNVQALPKLLERRHVVVNAETGSGKTLCMYIGGSM